MCATIKLIKGDITGIETDVIVNAANSSLLGGGGVDGAIHHKGGQAILEECMAIRKRQGKCPPGEAVYTTAGKLPAKYVIHTVGPVWKGGGYGEAQRLASCYFKSLALADSLGVRTVAFPNISTGVYGYPKPEAAKIAIEAVKQYFENGTHTLEEVWFVCFDEENYALYEKLLNR